MSAMYTDSPMKKTVFSAAEEAAMAELIVESPPSTVLCAVDGSEDSNVAFEAAMDIMKKEDKICLFHAYCFKKDEYLPFHLRSNVLREYETTLKGRLPESRYSLVWKHRMERSVKSVLEEVSAGTDPDFIVMGFTGRKAFNQPGAVNAGSIADFTMRELRVSCIIVKRSAFRVGSKAYVYAVKDTELCRVGFEELRRLLNPNDTIKVLFIQDDKHDPEGVEREKVQKMREYYEEKLAGVVTEGNGEFRVCLQTSVHPEDTLVRVVNSLHPSFCCLTPRLKDFKDSVTEKIIVSVQSSIVLLKPR